MVTNLLYIFIFFVGGWDTDSVEKLSKERNVAKQTNQLIIDDYCRRQLLKTGRKSIVTHDIGIFRKDGKTARRIISNDEEFKIMNH